MTVSDKQKKRVSKKKTEQKQWGVSKKKSEQKNDSKRGVSKKGVSKKSEPKKTVTKKKTVSLNWNNFSILLFHNYQLINIICFLLSFSLLLSQERLQINKIKVEGNFNTNKQINYLTNNNGRVNFNGKLKTLSRYKFSKIKNFYQLLFRLFKK